MTISRPELIGIGRPWRLLASLVGSRAYLDAWRAMNPATGYDAVDAAAADMRPGWDGLLSVRSSLPGDALGGSSGSWSVLGIAPRHRAGHIWRALLEGTAFELAAVPSVLPFNRKVIAAGSGSSSVVWRQVVSDVLGAEQLHQPWAESVRGAAMLTVHGLTGRVLEDLREEWSGGQPVTRTVPDPERSSSYARIARRWNHAAGIMRAAAHVA